MAMYPVSSPTDSAAGPVRIWLSDGSPVPSTDLDWLPVPHPTAFGVPASYKGTIDPQVPVGIATIEAPHATDRFILEAEWCVTFPDGMNHYLREPGRVVPETTVRLQGMIEGKWLDAMLGTTERRPASLGNNLLAAGPGIVITFAAIETDAIGEMTVSYRRLHHGTERLRPHPANGTCGRARAECHRPGAGGSAPLSRHGAPGHRRPKRPPHQAIPSWGRPGPYITPSRVTWFITVIRPIAASLIRGGDV